MTLDGKTLNCLSIGESSDAARTEWDAWVSGAFKHKYKAHGVIRRFTVECEESDAAYSGSQYESFLATAAAGSTVAFAVADQVRVYSGSVYITGVSLRAQDLAGKNVRYFTLQLLEA